MLKCFYLTVKMSFLLLSKEGAGGGGGARGENIREEDGEYLDGGWNVIFWHVFYTVTVNGINLACVRISVNCLRQQSGSDLPAVVPG